MTNKENKTNIHLCQAKETRLTHSLGGMVAQVLVIFALNN